MTNEFNYEKIVNEDDVCEIEDNLKGIVALLSALTVADSSGTHKYQKHSYETLQISLEESIKDLNSLKNGINYMRDHLTT